MAATCSSNFAPADIRRWSFAGSSVDSSSMIQMANHNAPVAMATTITQVMKFLRYRKKLRGFVTPAIT
ncbi:hypothetical protein GALL_509190 [mine drainage metagenome]|uniref:Uncharacterized protein n=1 Tax=mine drainage metagenome TaxID=410659 RepID=A0A1J5PI87_9ZZZZ